MKRLKEKATQKLAKLLCPQSLYGQLSACHGYAAMTTGKPEVYLPMAALYLVMALRGAH